MEITRPPPHLPFTCVHNGTRAVANRLSVSDVISVSSPICFTALTPHELSLQPGGSTFGTLCRVRGGRRQRTLLQSAQPDFQRDRSQQLHHTGHDSVACTIERSKEGSSIDEPVRGYTRILQEG